MLPLSQAPTETVVEQVRPAAALLFYSKVLHSPACIAFSDLTWFEGSRRMIISRRHSLVSKCLLLETCCTSHYMYYKQ